MKKIILILLCAIAASSFNINATLKEDLKTKWRLRNIACATAATASLAAFVPALISDLKAHQGTAQAEVPLCVIPLCTFILSCLIYE